MKLINEMIIGFLIEGNFIKIETPNDVYMMTNVDVQFENRTSQVIVYGNNSEVAFRYKQIEKLYSIQDLRILVENELKRNYGANRVISTGGGAMSTEAIDIEAIKAKLLPFKV
jgi:hypothetical protein